MQQASDFLAEHEALAAQVRPLDVAGLQRATLFNAWSVETIVRHLHFWNAMALSALTDPESLKQTMAVIFDGMTAGKRLPECEREQIDASGTALVDAWDDTARAVAEAYGTADPAHRCPWAGPSMSARSCITARQMETWAHGQAVFDLYGVDRSDTDRIRNIAVLGTNTFGWSFAVRGLEAPRPMPYVALTSPSGTYWEFGDVQQENRIEGSATEFCQVVTQTRNVVDTALTVHGDIATEWMNNAQCFAGGPVKPPVPGSRRKTLP